MFAKAITLSLQLGQLSEECFSLCLFTLIYSFLDSESVIINIHGHDLNLSFTNILCSCFLHNDIHTWRWFAVIYNLRKTVWSYSCIILCYTLHWPWLDCFKLVNALFKGSQLPKMIKKYSLHVAVNVISMTLTF